MPEDLDLEDGEIEDDDEEAEDCVVVDVKPAEPIKVEREPSPKKKSDHKKSSTPSSSSRKDKQNPNDEDDFMSRIESALAEGLKRSGIEPPMPNIKKQEADTEPERRQSRNSRKRKRKQEKKEDQKRKEQKRDSGSKVSFVKALKAQKF